MRWKKENIFLILVNTFYICLMTTISFHQSAKFTELRKIVAKIEKEKLRKNRA